jgi:hypothetical protein
MVLRKPKRSRFQHSAKTTPFSTTQNIRHGQGGPGLLYLIGPSQTKKKKTRYSQ